MTIHLHPLPPRARKRCDTRALEIAREETHRHLRDEMDEKRISKELVDKHNARIRASAEYRQNGGP